MNITYTISEATEVLRRIITPIITPFLPGDNAHSITIVPDNNHLDAYANVIASFPNHKYEQKIDAIKKLRELIAGLSLADAKYIIEAQPNTVLVFFARYKTLLNYSTRRY